MEKFCVSWGARQSPMMADIIIKGHLPPLGAWGLLETMGSQVLGRLVGVVLE